MTKRVIWKYEIPVDGQPHTFEMPFGSEAVSVGIGPSVQIGHVGMWVAAPQDTEKKRLIAVRVFATGEVFDDEVWDSYVGTAVDPQRGLVWHVLAMTTDKEH